MNKFEYMNDFVESLCNELENNPENFNFKTCTFNRIGSKTEFWATDGNRPITESWTGYSTDVVFSDDQGRKIRSSYNIAREKIASERQKRILSESAEIKNNSNDSVVFGVFVSIVAIIFFLMVFIF